MFKQRSIQWVTAKLMGHNHWCADWLATLLAADATLLDHILEQGRGYPHYLCLVNLGIQDKPDAPFNNADPAELAATIRHTSKRQLLNALYDPCPAGLAGALKRLAPRPLAQAGYRRLLRLLGERRARTYLLHNNETSHAQLRFLEYLPAELRDCPTIRGIWRRRDIDHFKQTIENIHHMSPQVSYADIALSIRHLVYPVSLKGIYINGRYMFKSDHLFDKRLWAWQAWVEKQLLRKDFPEAPWPGNDWIKPITSGAQLRQTARRMRNCIVEHVGRVVIGGTYLYATNREPYANIEIWKNGCPDEKGRKWKLIGIAGENNTKLDESSKTEIIEALEKSDIISVDTSNGLWEAVDELYRHL